MAARYTPRRFGARWRDATTPPAVLDIFKLSAVEDTWEVLLCQAKGGTRANTYIDGLELDPWGNRGPSFELTAVQAAAYRYRWKNHRVSWASLPEPAKEVVRDWLQPDDGCPND